MTRFDIMLGIHPPVDRPMRPIPKRLIIVGPRRSGKTTTLLSYLDLLNIDLSPIAVYSPTSHMNTFLLNCAKETFNSKVMCKTSPGIEFSVWNEQSLRGRYVKSIFIDEIYNFRNEINPHIDIFYYLSSLNHVPSIIITYDDVDFQYILRKEKISIYNDKVNIRECEWTVQQLHG